jgi:hypothetical protein
VSQQPQEVKTPFLVGAAVLGCTALYVAWLLFLGVLLLLGNAFGAVDTVFIASLAIFVMTPGIALFYFWNRVLRRPDD